MEPSLAKLVSRVARRWLVVSRKLGIRVEAPYTMMADGESAQCVAFLPDFGSPNGMVIGAMLSPASATDWSLEELAKRKGMFCSFLSVLGYAECDETKYREVLEDWGYFGPIENCPGWYAGYNHTQIALAHREIVRAWTEASHCLAVRIVTDVPPFAGLHTFIARLPDFGSNAGMMLGAIYPPLFDVDRGIQQFAKDRGMFCAFLRGPDYMVYDEGKYKAALTEWGYFGPSENRPRWFTGEAGAS